MIYINMRDEGRVETCDEFPSGKAGRKEAREQLAEYRMADPNGEYWLSPRSCRSWREQDVTGVDSASA